MAAYTELYIDQGTTWTNVITIGDDITGANINVANYVVRSQIRRSKLAATPTANITCEITDASNGQITMSLTDAQTSAIPDGRYFFDVEMVDTSNNVSRILEGLVFIEPNYTK